MGQIWEARGRGGPGFAHLYLNRDPFPFDEHQNPPSAQDPFPCPYPRASKTFLESDSSYESNFASDLVYDEEEVTFDRPAALTLKDCDRVEEGKDCVMGFLMGDEA